MIVVMKTCETCRGTGDGPFPDLDDCRGCGGRGEVPHNEPDLPKHPHFEREAPATPDRATHFQTPRGLSALAFEARISTLLKEVLPGLDADSTGLCLEVHIWRKRDAQKAYSTLQKAGFTVGIQNAPCGGRSRGATLRIWQ